MTAVQNFSDSPQAAQSAAPRPGSPVVYIEVWHANEQEFLRLQLLCLERAPAELDARLFERMAAVCVSRAALSDMLEDAYAQTQNIDGSWRGHCACRSTSMGDVLSLTVRGERLYYVVCREGFAPVRFHPQG